jgi:hypothetical protein
METRDCCTYFRITPNEPQVVSLYISRAQQVEIYSFKILIYLD